MENRKQKIFVVDDHPVVRKGIKDLINETEDLAVCGEAETVAQAMRGIGERQPDLALLDLYLGNLIALDLIRGLRKQYPDLRMLILTMKADSLFAERALKAGANGYLLKEEKSETILSAIRRALQGQRFLSPKIDSKVLRRMGQEENRSPSAFLERLSNREIQVFKLIGEGCATRQIAESLSLSLKTVETLRLRIMKKLRLKKSSELVHFAVRCSDQW